MGEFDDFKLLRECFFFLSRAKFKILNGDLCCQNKQTEIPCDSIERSCHPVDSMFQNVCTTCDVRLQGGNM